ncbi:hypothetical protein AAIB33_13290 [Microbacterium sp. AZCO]
MSTPDQPRPHREEREGLNAGRGILYGLLFSLVGVGIITAIVIVVLNVLG